MLLGLLLGIWLKVTGVGLGGLEIYNFTDKLTGYPLKNSQCVEKTGRGGYTCPVIQWIQLEI